MPIKAKRPCSQPGCPELTDGGRCPKHQTHHHRQESMIRGNSASHGYNHQWKKVRDKKLSINPICECGCGRLAEMVHHIKPVAEYPQLRLRMDNLMSLTNECHNKLEYQQGKRF